MKKAIESSPTRRVMWLEIRAANKRREAFHDGRNQGTIMEDEHTMAMAAAAKRSHTNERGLPKVSRAINL